MRYNGGLENASLRDSELLSEAFCKSHPLLAQKVVTRSARAAVSKIGAEALVSNLHGAMIYMLSCSSLPEFPHYPRLHLHV